MLDKLIVVGIPCSLLLAAGILRLLHVYTLWAFFAAAMLPLAAVASKRPVKMSRLPLILLLLFVFCPAELRHNMLALPLMAALIFLITALSALTVVSSLMVALGWHNRQSRWLRLFAIDGGNDGLRIARIELLLAWFALFRWRATRSDQPLDAVPFGCASTGTDVVMAWVAAGSGLIEAPMLHIVLRHFSAPAAWIATVLTVATTVYLVGFAKSLVLWPTLLFEDRLVIRLGAVSSCTLARSEIDEARLMKEPTPYKTGFVRLFAFDTPNFAVKVKGQDYLFRVDRPIELLAELNLA